MIDLGQLVFSFLLLLYRKSIKVLISGLILIDIKVIFSLHSVKNASNKTWSTKKYKISPRDYNDSPQS